jgi:UDP-4-amino-4-deoxy-L-arabinose formyltransferase/UDP-glucuronic acid dehydrogenase (UDP-4-keto-hexauronic acid decarboxylating)
VVRDLTAVHLTIGLVAEEAAGAQALKSVAARGHRVAAVFSDSAAGAPGASVADVAVDLGIPVRPALEVREPALAGELRAAGVDLLLNVHSLHIVDAAVVTAPPLGAFNLHPGPLPERAGLNAPGWALYEGANSHGVTLHRMTPGVDEGPIAFIERFPVADSDTALKVMTRCIRLGLPLIERLLELAERGEPIPEHPQDLSRRHWFGAGPPERGTMDFDRPARKVADFVRACDYRPFPSPWPFPRCAVDGEDLVISSVEALEEAADTQPGTVADGEAGAVLVAAADTWVRVDWVEVAGERTQAAEALRPGQRLYRARELTGSRRR